MKIKRINYISNRNCEPNCIVKNNFRRFCHRVLKYQERKNGGSHLIQNFSTILCQCTKLHCTKLKDKTQTARNVSISYEFTERGLLQKNTGWEQSLNLAELKTEPGTRVANQSFFRIPSALFFFSNKEQFFFGRAAVIKSARVSAFPTLNSSRFLNIHAVLEHVYFKSLIQEPHKRRDSQ